MRVVVITPFTTAPGLSAGGVESVAECLVASLSRLADVAIDVIAPSIEGRQDIEQRDFGSVHWLPHSRPAFLGYWLGFRWRVHERLRELGPDVAHFQGFAGWALGYRPPSVVTIHGIPELDTRYSGKPGARFRSLVIELVESRARARDDAKIIISPYVSEILGGRLCGRQWHIENPVHPDFFALSRSPVAGRLLYVGRISSRKNIENLLRAFARVAAVVPNATLRLAGTAESPEFMSACRSLADELCIAGRIAWLGNLPRQELLHEYENAAALALLSHQETAPMVIAEAMAAAIPVVASRVCGNPHLVQEGATGWLADPSSVEEIAQRLVLALQDRENAEIGRRARQHAMARFDPQGVARRTHEVYVNAISAHVSSSS